MAIHWVRHAGAYISLSAVSVAMLGARGAETADSRITILVYDYADLAADTLLGAEQETRRIFLQSGVDVLWRHCRTSDSSPLECPDPGAMTPAVRLVTRFKLAPDRVHADAMGYAIGDFATVSVEFAKQLEESGVARLPEILGHAMAHEIGHLLLPGNAHSVSGVMRAQWRQGEWRLLAQGKLNFTLEQARFLRAELLHRLQPVANQTP